MNTIFRLFLFGTVLLLAACSVPAEEELVTVVEDVNLISLTEDGLNLSFVNLPDKGMEMEPAVTFNDQLGRYEISLSEDLTFCISEEETSIDDIKNDLRNDLLFTYKFYDEGTDALLYQAVLPDGTDYLYQYAKILKVNSKKFLLFSDTHGEFSLQQIKLIKKVINSVSSLD